MQLFMFYLITGAVVRREELHWYQINQSWWNVQDTCRKNHIDLVTVRDADENEQITKDGWIGLHRHDSDWRWSRGNLKANYTPWQIGEPQNNSRCVHKMLLVTGWYGADCNDPFPFYCVDEHLVLVKENKTWEEALEHCRALNVYDLSDRYDLAELITDYDHQRAQDMLLYTAVDVVWAGLRYLGDMWTWVNGQSHNDDWSSCPGDKRCGTLERNVTVYVDRRRCHRKKYFLCSRVRGVV